MIQISIVPAELVLVSNQQVLEQNNTVLLRARLLDQNRNPMSGQHIALYVEHPDYPGPIRIQDEVTDQDGTVSFYVSLKNPGDFEFVAEIGSVTSAPCKVTVNMSLAPSGPRSWQGVVNSMSRLESDLSIVMGQMIAAGQRPTKEDLCNALGLNYTLARDRGTISSAIYDLKLLFDYLWRNLYESSTAFPRDFAKFMQDAAAYASWKLNPDSVYSRLVSVYHQSEDEIHEAWVLSRMWEEFLNSANTMYGLHFMVAFYDRVARVYYYVQPSFWEYVEKQIQSGSRLTKGLRTILTRHRDLGMMLTSGEPAYKALEDSEATLKMITDSAPSIRCELCWRSGTTTQFQTIDELYAHLKAAH